MVQSDLIEQAKKAHKQDDLASAEALYRKVLASCPEDPDANHLLGVIHFQREEYDTAVELIRKALALRPDHAASYNNLGSVQKALGLYSEALESFKKAIALQSDFAEAHNNLGAVYMELEELENAEEAYTAALRYQPNYIKALNNLGNLFLETGDLAKALQLYGKALEQQPDAALTNYNLGCALLRGGRYAEAEAALQKALAKEPENVEVLKSLGMLYLGGMQHDKAIEHFKRILELRPDSAESYIYMGNAYLACDDFAASEHFLAQALELDPDSIQALNNLAMLYNRQGKYPQAEQFLTKARGLSQENVAVLSNLASTKVFQGDMSGAITLCRQAIEQNPDFIAAYYQLAQLLPPHEGQQLAADISSMLAGAPLSLAERIQLHFALGKLFEDQAEYPQAFHHFAEANRLRRSTIVYSPKSQSEVVEQTIRVYDERIFGQLEGKGCTSPVPIFIVGMPRSGTTLTEQIISSHPDVHGAGELPYIHETLADYLKLAHGEFFIPAGHRLTGDDLKELGARYVDRVRTLAGTIQHVTDKMPGNFMYLGLIHLILPRAKIIHCVRDPLDTCFSIYKRFFTYGHPWAYSFEDLGAFYLNYHRLMVHWRRVLPGQFYDLQYENLVRDQKGETKKLLEFCGLDWHENCLSFYDNNRPVNTASSIQVRKPITTASVGLWKKYKEQLQPLEAILRPMTNDA